MNLQHHQMLLFCALDSAQRYRAVQCHKAALLPDGQAHQIQIGQLPVTVNFFVIKRSGIKQAQVVRPELMLW